MNEHLAEHGHAARIDHRSLDAQGIDREPTSHKGPAVTAIERRGEQARVSERIREDITERLRVAAELGRLERESNDARAIDRRHDRRPEGGHQRPRCGARDIRRRLRSRTEAVDARHAPRRPDAVARVDCGAGQGGATDNAASPAPALDLTGDVAAAATSRSVESPSSTREQAHAAWLSYRAEQSNEPSAAEKSTPRIILPDHDHTLK